MSWQSDPLHFASVRQCWRLSLGQHCTTLMLFLKHELSDLLSCFSNEIIVLSRLQKISKMEPPLRGPIRKKRSTRASNLTISLAPELAPPTSRSITSPVRRSPARPSPARQSAPSSLVSPVRSTTITQQRNYSGPSPDFLAPPLSASLVSADYGSIRSEPPEERADSTETVRGPLTLDRGGTPPLTPFPRWVSDDEDDSCDVRGWEESVQQSTSRMNNKQHSYDGRHVPVTIVRLEGRWIISSAIHGFVLVTQFAVSLGVFSALMWVTVWKEDEPGSDFTEW